MRLQADGTEIETLRSGTIHTASFIIAAKSEAELDEMEKRLREDFDIPETGRQDPCNAVGWGQYRDETEYGFETMWFVKAERSEIAAEIKIFKGFYKRIKEELRAEAKAKSNERNVINALASIDEKRCEVLRDELDRLESEVSKAHKAFREIWAWTQDPDVLNPRGIIAGIVHPHLTKEERVAICEHLKRSCVGQDSSITK